MISRILIIDSQASKSLILSPNKIQKYRELLQKLWKPNHDIVLNDMTIANYSHIQK